MTLIISVATSRSVVQVSDRRLTNANGSIASDDTIKALVVNCQNARFSISYTGISEVGIKRRLLGFIRGTRTDIWLAKYLSSIRAHSLDLDSILEAVRDQLTVEFRFAPLKQCDKRLTVICAGYGYSSVAPDGSYKLGPFMAVISNMEDDNDWILTDALSDFKKVVLTPLPGSDPKKDYKVIVKGSTQAISPVMWRRIRQLGRKRFFHKNTGLTIANELISTIRLAAKTPSSGMVIGSHCIMVAIPPLRHEPVLAGGYVKGSFVQHMPHIVDRQGAVTDMRIVGNSANPTPPAAYLASDDGFGLFIGSPQSESDEEMFVEATIHYNPVDGQD